MGPAPCGRPTTSRAPSLDWADAAIIDLAGDGLDDLNRLRVECPRLRVLAIATDAAQEGSARSAGADEVLVEPFSIADVVEAIRTLGPARRGAGDRPAHRRGVRGAGAGRRTLVRHVLAS